MLQPKVTKIINEYLNEDTENYNEIRNNLFQCKNIFQYVYSNIFSEIYCSTKRWGFDLKSSFHIMFKTYKDKKKLGMLGKKPQSHKGICHEVSVYMQKPITIDDFYETVEKEIKELAEKRKKERWKAAENNILLKKKKQEDTKNEAEMWNRLRELNNEFKNI